MMVMSGKATAYPPLQHLKPSSWRRGLRGFCSIRFTRAKGFAGLVGLTRQGFFKPTDNVLFLHSGGSCALFAYEETVLGAMAQS